MPILSLQTAVAVFVTSCFNLKCAENDRAAAETSNMVGYLAQESCSKAVRTGLRS